MGTLLDVAPTCWSEFFERHKIEVHGRSKDPQTPRRVGIGYADMWHDLCIVKQQPLASIKEWSTGQASMVGRFVWLRNRLTVIV